ncbi:hypothetical protein [Enhygromyxa salina]|uniref:Uncharacterized protein n=1 Tax=Enhygromyxa salina TaxID=215803 RepID=A0A2S9YN70_9BACT|nr:hypothetical protein [Enhygromyxa salina]PRQ06537.1 hypothetical protein ENSA7_38570 [Enhygromyxa salina]
MRRRSVFTLLTLALTAIPLTADAEYRYLCTSVPGACEYSSADVPKLLADVCYYPGSNAIKIKGTAPCPSGSNAFSLIHGEIVDPQTGQVSAYAPLDDACAAGLCAEFAPHDDPQESVMCCENGGPCWPGGTCGGVLYWCHDGVCNDDGTITCFDGEQL